MRNGIRATVQPHYTNIHIDRGNKILYRQYKVVFAAMGNPSADLGHPVLSSSL